MASGHALAVLPYMTIEILQILCCLIVRRCCACCRHHVASGRLLLAMQRRRGFLDNSPYNDKVLSVLDKLLDVECKAEGVCATDDGEVYTLARSMYHRAYLVQRKRGRSSKFHCSREPVPDQASQLANYVIITRQLRYTQLA